MTDISDYWKQIPIIQEKLRRVAERGALPLKTYRVTVYRTIRQEYVVRACDEEEADQYFNDHEWKLVPDDKEILPQIKDYKIEEA